jgi:hypothetical protein
MEAPPPDTYKRLQDLQGRKDNSIIVEFAKRATLVSAARQEPSKAWPKEFIGQITNYLVARDLAGHIGRDHRCKSVPEMADFKASITREVREKTPLPATPPTDPRGWAAYVQSTMESLKHVR